MGKPTDTKIRIALQMRNITRIWEKKKYRKMMDTFFWRYNNSRPSHPMGIEPRHPAEGLRKNPRGKHGKDITCRTLKPHENMRSELGCESFLSSSRSEWPNGEASAKRVKVGTNQISIKICRINLRQRLNT